MLTERDNQNRKRLRNILNQTQVNGSPVSWEKSTFAVGGLTDIGFSKVNPSLLLVLSAQGRGLIDSAHSKLICRDQNVEGDYQDVINLLAKGIGPVANENIAVSGLFGGGLPQTTERGDKLRRFGLDWPIEDIIYEPSGSSTFDVKSRHNCTRIFHDYGLLTFGFSYCGNFIAIATESHVNIFKKI